LENVVVEVGIESANG